MSQIVNSKFKQGLLLLAILWLATALRFYRLESQSFWNDEGNSARLSERAIPLIIEGTAGDIHPPLYYLALHSWRALLGDSEFGLRSFSAFVGVGLVAVTFGLGQTLTGRSGANLAALFVAVNPALIYYSQETRMYELLALWVVLASWLLVGWLHRPGPGLAVAYVLVVVAGLYTHYFFPAGLLAQGLLVVGKKRALSGRWLVMLVMAGLLYLPWLPIFVRQAGGRPSDSVGLLAFLRDSGRFILFGPTLATNWPLVLGSSLSLWGLRAAWDKRQWFIPAGAILPILLAFVAGTTREAYFKFLLMSGPFWALLLALPGPNKKWPAILYGGLGLAMLWVSGQALTNLYFNPAYARADYRAIAARIAADTHPATGIILDAPNQWEVFTYYYPVGAAVYPIPRGYPDPAGITAELSQIAAQHDRLYAIFWGEAERDPQRLVESWLDSHTFKATDEWIGDVRLVMYAVPGQAATTMDTPLQLTFGQHITLLGYTLKAAELPAGDVVQLTLFWQTDQSLENRYKIFLHLVGEDSLLIAQQDSEPVGDLAPTTTWQPGQIIIDNHGLFIPAGTPPGRYTLLLGLYDLTDPKARLLIGDPAGASNAWPLSPIEITP